MSVDFASVKVVIKESYYYYYYYYYYYVASFKIFRPHHTFGTGESRDFIFWCGD